MFRGNAPARIDDKGRLKVPNAFRTLVEGRHGRELFLTSVTGESVRIYPMPVWLDIEQKLAAMPSTHPSKLRFLDRVNYYGAPGELDTQGRVLIPPRLASHAGIEKDVVVIGVHDHCEIWDRDAWAAHLSEIEGSAGDVAERLANQRS